MGEWKEYKLGDICTKIGSGVTPKGGKEACIVPESALPAREQPVGRQDSQKFGKCWI